VFADYCSGIVGGILTSRASFGSPLPHPGDGTRTPSADFIMSSTSLAMIGDLSHKLNNLTSTARHGQDGEPRTDTPEKTGNSTPTAPCDRTGNSTPIASSDRALTGTVSGRNTADYRIAG